MRKGDGEPHIEGRENLVMNYWESLSRKYLGLKMNTREKRKLFRKQITGVQEQEESPGVPQIGVDAFQRRG